MTASTDLADLGIITIEDASFFTRQIARASAPPVLVHGDTGCGETLNVMHVVRTFEDAGAAEVRRNLVFMARTDAAAAEEIGGSPT